MNIYNPLTKFYKSRLADKIKSMSQPLATCFGLDAFAYSRVTWDGDFYQISNVADQSIMYWYTGLYKKNLFLQSPHSYEAGTFLLRSIADPNFQQMLDSFNQKGIDWHLRIVRKDRHYCHQFLFGSKQADIPFSSLFFNCSNILQSFCDYFLEEGQELCKKCDNFTFALPELLGDKYYQEIVQKPTGIDVSLKHKFLTQIHGNSDLFHSGIADLTKREKECIRHYMEGKTNRQVAEALHLSTGQLKIT